MQADESGNPILEIGWGRHRLEVGQEGSQECGLARFAVAVRQAQGPELWKLEST